MLTFCLSNWLEQPISLVALVRVGKGLRIKGHGFEFFILRPFQKISECYERFENARVPKRNPKKKFI